jgi:hypothetical protein
LILTDALFWRNVVVTTKPLKYYSLLFFVFVPNDGSIDEVAV